MQKIFINLAKTDFNCPHCNKKHNDDNDVYLKRCNKNKHFTTKIKCSCGEWFGFCYNQQGDAVGFKL